MLFICNEYLNILYWTLISFLINRFNIKALVHFMIVSLKEIHVLISMVQTYFIFANIDYKNLKESIKHPIEYFFT